MNHQQQEQQHLREEDQSNLIDDDCRESVSPDRRPVKVVKRSRYKRIRKKIGFKHLWSVLGIVFYTLLGGVLFLFVERPVDLHERQQLYAVYQTSQKDLIKQLEQLGENYAKNRDREYFLSQLQTAILGYEAKIDVHVSNESLWDFWNAMYYAGTRCTSTTRDEKIVAQSKSYGSKIDSRFQITIYTQFEGCSFGGKCLLPGYAEIPERVLIEYMNFLLAIKAAVSLMQRFLNTHEKSKGVAFVRTFSLLVNDEQQLRRRAPPIVSYQKAS
ncbi:conserved hypothetical protein [Trichinella spiralis]|uniref:hypothetical protein n=1 Tax=Trichinella spiralis TaxID=6334 RepID=UPI0001EFB1ED|nr:conserved hypothetical protein [Trichinella spiralis]